MMPFRRSTYKMQVWKLNISISILHPHPASFFILHSFSMLTTRVFVALFASLVPVSLAAATGYTYGCNSTTPDVYEAIHQREYILAETLDIKDWDRLGKSMTQDIVYDSRPLGPDYGGLSVGFQQVIENTKKAFGDAKVAHHVSNAIIKLNGDATKANVTT
jgi:hypothetical protein